MPIAVIIGTAKRNIIVDPCIVKIWLYRSGPMSVFSGRESCMRIAAASSPPSRKKTRAVQMYRLPTDLWLTLFSQPRKPVTGSHVAYNRDRSASSIAGGKMSPSSIGGAVTSTFPDRRAAPEDHLATVHSPASSRRA